MSRCRRRPDLHAPAVSSEIARAYVDEGLTCQAIAERFNTSGPTIARMLETQGIRPRPKSPKSGRYKTLSAPLKRKAAADFIRGVPLADLEETYGVNARTIRNYVSEMMPGRQPPTHGDRTRSTLIQRDYITASDAAEELGISRFTVSEYLHAGKFIGAFQIGKKGRFWLIPRKAVDARRERISARTQGERER